MFVREAGLHAFTWVSYVNKYPHADEDTSIFVMFGKTDKGTQLEVSSNF